MDEKGALRSEQFDDVYFSAQDGFAETRHVFLDGNKLPDLWKGRPLFTICETGFGTGLNFLAVWDLFDRSMQGDQHLHFISFEKYPLAPKVIQGALSIFDELPDERLDMMLKYYPIQVPGFHYCDINENVSLTLIFDDINNSIGDLDAVVDCWFLDGFKPSSNPDMWSETVFEGMGRLSREGTRFATFTAAGFVKRGLQNVGFSVEKIKGFGRKREMLVGSYTGTPT